MKNHVRRFYRRHEPGGIRAQQLKAGVGATVAIAGMGLLAGFFDIPLLIAPFGASAVLVFGQARSPLAQPANLLGGYVVAGLITALLVGLFPGNLAVASLAVGLAISAMLILRVSHPPAGAIPLVAHLSSMTMWTLLNVVAVGGLLLIVLAMIHHRLPPRQAYPLHLD